MTTDPVLLDDVVRCGSYDAELYERVHRGCPGDVAFYRSVGEGANTVVELGCGYGRVLCEVAPTVGLAVGVDSDEGLVELARSRVARLPAGLASRVVLLRGDMSTLSLACRFDRVLIPFGGLQCLLDESSQLAALRVARSLLASGGKLAFDVYSADVMHAEQRCECEVVEEAPWDGPDLIVELESGGEAQRVLEHTRWCRRQQRIDAVYEYRTGGGSRRWGAIRQRYLLATDIPSLLERAGLLIDDWYGDFFASPRTDDSERHVIVARSR